MLHLSPVPALYKFVGLIITHSVAAPLFHNLSPTNGETQTGEMMLLLLPHIA